MLVTRRCVQAVLVRVRHHVLATAVLGRDVVFEGSHANTLDSCGRTRRNMTFQVRSGVTCLRDVPGFIEDFYSGTPCSL